MKLSLSRGVARRVPTGRHHSFRVGYRPELDGLRGISVIVVVLGHAHLMMGRAGSIAVTLFFVLSGFLITSLLVQEWLETGAISLKRFYCRRILRLFPALLAMLAAVVAYLWVFGSLKDAIRVTRDALIALFYVKNWALVHAYQFDLFSHAWTLSIEEQFYLLWPPILIVLLGRIKTFDSLATWLLLGYFLALLDRAALTWWNAPLLRINYGTDSRADALLLGCLIAAFAFGKYDTKMSEWKRLFVPMTWGGVVLVILLCVTPQANRQTEANVALGAISFSAACVVAGLTFNERGWLHGFLSQGWLVYVGRISYGLYLWHFPLFLLVQARGWPFAAELAVEMSLTIALTLASFYLLERPCLKLKEQLRFDKIR